MGANESNECGGYEELTMAGIAMRVNEWTSSGECDGWGVMDGGEEQLECFNSGFKQHCLCTASSILARTALLIPVDHEGAAQEDVSAIPRIDQVLLAIIAPAGSAGTIRNSRTGNLILYKAGAMN